MPVRLPPVRGFDERVMPWFAVSEDKSTIGNSAPKIA
jgi:hypothetical protein